MAMNEQTKQERLDTLIQFMKSAKRRTCFVLFWPSFLSEVIGMEVAG